MEVSIILCICILLACICSISSEEFSHLSGLDSLTKTSVKKTSVPPCDACRNLVQSFLKAVEETTRLSFEGGDADWERKLGNYENSELRFIEIQEKLCSDLTSGTDQCYNLAERYEEELEDWFYGKRNKFDLFTYLCINHMKICCPNNTYGSYCVPCPGGVEEPCNGHGKCKNAGTRQEPASCLCDAGYTGDLCNQCQKGYYRDLNSSVLSCKICDKACNDYCRGPGPNNCEVCSEGYYFVQNEGCIVEDSDDEDNEDNTTENILNETEKSELRFTPDVHSINGEQSEHQEL